MIYFVIYVDKLEVCLEDRGCVGLNLCNIFVISPYAYDTILMIKSPYALNKQLKISNRLMKINKTI